MNPHTDYPADPKSADIRTALNQAIRIRELKADRALLACIALCELGAIALLSFYKF